MNDFTFGNEAKNSVFTHHHERANILCACGLATYLIELRGNVSPPQLGACHGSRSSLRRISYRQEAVSKHRAPETLADCCYLISIVVPYGPTKGTWTADVLDLLVFKDGKIIELIEFADTGQIRDTMSRALI
jgi:hypothetical protein